MNDPQVIAWIGTGAMGLPMALHAASKGYTIRLWARNPQRLSENLKNSALFQTLPEHQKPSCFNRLEEALSGTDTLVTCVSQDQDVESLISQALPLLRQNSLIIDHSTIGTETVKKLNALSIKHHCHLLDAPVSGGQEGAQKGQLTLMCGGDEQAFERAKHLFAAYTKKIRLMGPSGSGQLTKMVNQICVGGVIQGLAEGLLFAKKSGLDPFAVIETISQGAAQSWQMDNRHKSMIENRYDYGFAVDLMCKDLAICLNTAQTWDISLPLTQMIQEFYRKLQNQGFGFADTSALLLYLETLAPDQSKQQ
jgi:3-hydroxyisobutyrate dehydrogenase-like beta-hydroxyacid dehydrogenase